MIREALQLVPYALLAAISPTVFAATLVVIGSGRIKALLFGIGFVAGQLLACAILVLLGGIAIPDRKANHPTFQALVEVGLGIALLWLALRVSRRPPVEHKEPSPRTQAVYDRLKRLHVLTAFFAGLLLGIGGPKRLVLTAIASSSIAASGVVGAEEVGLILWYVGLAAVLVWVPVTVFVLLGDRAVAYLGAAQKWLSGHQHQATIYGLVVLGVVLVGSGAVSLL